MPDLFRNRMEGGLNEHLERNETATGPRLIACANEMSQPILALDVPSGLDVTTGKAHQPTVRATATLTLALPKTGLVAKHAATWVGELYCADISVPPGLYASETLGISCPVLFSQSDIVRIV